MGEEINLKDIQVNENENDLVEIIEPTKEPKAKRKYTKRKNKEINEEINNNINEIKQSETENLLHEQYLKSLFEKPLEPIETEEDKIYKSQLIAKISRYKDIFSEYLKDISYKNMDNLKIPELELLLQRTKESVSNRNMESNLKGMIFMAPKLIENVGSYAGLQLDGYANVVNSQKDYYYTCQEILIEQSFYDKLNMSPAQRLGFIVGTSALMVHNANSYKNQQIEDKLNSNIDTNNFNDL